MKLLEINNKAIVLVDQEEEDLLQAVGTINKDFRTRTICQPSNLIRINTQVKVLKVNNSNSFMTVVLEASKEEIPQDQGVSAIQNKEDFTEIKISPHLEDKTFNSKILNSKIF